MPGDPRFPNPVFHKIFSSTTAECGHPLEFATIVKPDETCTGFMTRIENALLQQLHDHDCVSG